LSFFLDRGVPSGVPWAPLRFGDTGGRPEAAAAPTGCSHFDSPVLLFHQYSLPESSRWDSQLPTTFRGSLASVIGGSFELDMGTAGLSAYLFVFRQFRSFAESFMY
jgi:hypothetical protein